VYINQKKITQENLNTNIKILTNMIRLGSFVIMVLSFLTLIGMTSGVIQEKIYFEEVANEIVTFIFLSILFGASVFNFIYNK
jgi:uncharacterized membrane protein